LVPAGPASASAGSQASCYVVALGSWTHRLLPRPTPSHSTGNRSEHMFEGCSE
jgi:hypothetical protein